MMKSLQLNRVARLAGGDESGVALITALLAILVTAMFAIVMLGVLLSQMMPTKLEQATTRTVFAAEAGINATVGQLRNVAAAPDALGNIYGNRKLLPCTASGTVNTSGSAAAYTVTVSYFTVDPTKQPAAWRSSNAMVCTPGFGPASVPSYAVITSSGTGLTVVNAPGKLDRTIQAVYAFKVTSNNIPGGHIFSWDKTSNKEDFCLEATSQVAGANVKYVDAATCGSKENLQLWIYDKFYRIQLASTTVPGYTGDVLCVDAVPNGGTPVKAVLNKCIDTSSSNRWSQLWSWTGDASWASENNGITNSTTNYLSSGSTSAVSAGTFLYVWNQNPGSAGWGAFDPQSAVGAGGASKSTNQMVNALQFGRCADVTHASITEQIMIAYPCKQDPTPGQPNLAWNHKWFYDEPAGTKGTAAPQLIKVYVNNTTLYCLKSPGPGGGYVHFETGCSTTSPQYSWTRTADTGTFDTSYTFADGNGLCLAVDPTAPLETWASLKTMPCSTSLAQKWNAPAGATAGSLGDYWELP